MIIILLKMMVQPTAHVKKTGGGIPSKKPRELDSTPTTATKVELEIRGDGKTVVDWINGHAKQKTPIRTVEVAQKCRLLFLLPCLSSLHCVLSVDPSGLRALKRYFH